LPGQLFKLALTFGLAIKERGEGEMRGLLIFLLGR